MFSVGGLVADDGSRGERFLPTTSVSSLGLAAVIVRRTGAPPARGGLRCREHRSVCGIVFDGLLSAMSAGDVKWSAKIIFAERWECAWPRPTGEGRGCCLSVDAQGIVDFSEWREAVASGGFAAKRP